MDDPDEARFAILAGEGVKTLKIDRLCDGLGVTKDGFQWHLDRMSSYRTAPIQNAAGLVPRRPPPHRRIVRFATKGTAFEFLRIRRPAAGH